jgi:hypothetical protein
MARRTREIAQDAVHDDSVFGERSPKLKADPAPSVRCRTDLSATKSGAGTFNPALNRCRDGSNDVRALCAASNRRWRHAV